MVRGLEQPVVATQAPGEPRRLYVVEQPGRIRVVENGRLRAAPFLDIRSLVQFGGEQGLLGLAFSPVVRPGRHVLRQLLAAAERRHRRRPLPRPQRAGRGGQRAARSSASSSRTRTTTAVISPSAQTGGSGSGWATAAPAATPRIARRTWTRCSGRCSASTSVRRSRSRRSSRSGSATRGATASTGRPACCGSATSARARSRRSTGSPGPGTGLVNFGWDVYEGRSRFEDKDARHRPARAARRAVHARRGLLGHRRLRLPRAVDPENQRPLHVRRLLQRHDLVDAGDRRRRAPRARSESQGCRRSVRGFAASSTPSRTRASCTASRKLPSVPARRVPQSGTRGSIPRLRRGTLLEAPAFAVATTSPIPMSSPAP